MGSEGRRTGDPVGSVSSAGNRRRSQAVYVKHIHAGSNSVSRKLCAAIAEGEDAHMSRLDRYKRRALRIAAPIRRAMPIRVVRGVRRSRVRRLGARQGLFHTFGSPKPTPALPGLSAAVAAGERVRAGLAWEWTQLELTPSSWQKTVAGRQIDLLLVEIAGAEIVGWRDAGSDALTSLLSWAREVDVPVVVWVTCGSVETELAASWIDSATQVFVDSEDVVDLWQSRWPDAAIGILGPAAQPRLHNPLQGRAARNRDRAAAVIVHGKPVALDALAKRTREDVDVWPADAESAAKLRSLPGQRSVMRNRRIEPRSPTLSRYRVVAEVGVDDYAPSWWTVEAGSAQTAVVVDGPTLDRIPADLRSTVTVAENPGSLRLDLAARIWQEELRDREGVRLARAVWDRHTYADRVDQITAAVGLEVNRPGDTVSVIVSTNRHHALDNVLEMVSRQEHTARGATELILVLHGLDVNIRELEARAADFGLENRSIIQADRSLRLGACLNLGIDAAKGDLIAKMDDDNFYGRHYLTDLVAAFDYTEAGIVGKWAHYVWLRSTGAVVLRFKHAEHRYNHLVQGGSILMKRDVANALRFRDLARGVDTDLLDRARLARILTYSADRFNYVSIRGTDRNSHTWTIADTGLMNSASTVVFFGDPREHVEV